MSTEVRNLIKRLRKLGLTVEHSRSNHHKVYDAHGRYITTLPNTPSEYRSLLNAKAQLRRSGIDV